MRVKWLAVVVVTITMSITAFAEEKIAVVDITHVVEQSSQMATLKTTLEKQFSGRQDKMVQRQKGMQGDIAKLTRDASVMKAADLKALKEKISTQQGSLQQEQVKLQQDFYQARDGGLKVILDKVQSIVKKISAEKGYTLVMRKEGTVYFDPAVDITTSVADKLK